MKALFAIVYLMLGAGMLSAQYEPPALNEWDAQSPDGVYLAVTRIIPDDIFAWKLERDTGRLVVVTSDTAPNNSTYVRYDLGRLVAHVEWSPDSKFLVMTTVSAGGHSPWHFNSYVYCVDDKTLRYMDDVIGLVVDAKFKFVGPHTVEMKIPGPSGSEVDFEHPKSVKVDLTKQAPLMKKQEGRKEGNI